MKEKTRHDGDCTIYASLHNGMPEAGICVCGYGWGLARLGDFSEMYSQELQEKLIRDAGRNGCAKEREGLVSRIFTGGGK